MSQVVFSCRENALNDSERLGPEAASDLGSGGGRRRGRCGEMALKVNCIVPNFHAPSQHKQIPSDPLIALENLTLCKNGETKITALPVAWKLWKHGTVMRQSGEKAKPNQNWEWKFYAINTKG